MLSGVVKPWSQDWLIAARAYPNFCSMKRLEVRSIPTSPGQDASPSQVTSRQLVRFPQQFAGTHLYTVERGTVRVSVLPKNTTQCPRPGLKPRPLAPESSALTMRPPSLPHAWLVADGVAGGNSVAMKTDGRVLTASIEIDCLFNSLYSTSKAFFCFSRSSLAFLRSYKPKIP